MINIPPPILFKTIDYPIIGVFIAQHKRLSHPGSDRPRPSLWVVKALRPLAEPALGSAPLEGPRENGGGHGRGDLEPVTDSRTHYKRKMALEGLSSRDLDPRTGLYKEMRRPYRGFQPRERWKGGGWLGVHPHPGKDGGSGDTTLPFLFDLILHPLSPFTTPRLPRPHFPFPLFSLHAPASPQNPKIPPTDASLLASSLQTPRPSQGRQPPSYTSRGFLCHPLGQQPGSTGLRAAGRETNLRSEERSCLQRVRFLIIFSVTGESSNPGHRAACAHRGSARPSPGSQPAKGSGSPRTKNHKDEAAAVTLPPYTHSQALTPTRWNSHTLALLNTHTTHTQG